MSKTNFWLILFSIFSMTTYAQNTTIEGYVFESGNRGYLNFVKIQVLEENSNQLFANTITDQDGLFRAVVPVGKTYVIATEKDLFEPKRTTITTQKKDKNKKVFAKIEMIRKPGYLFDVTLAEVMVPGKEEVDAVTGAKIEVYNNTTKDLVLDLNNHPYPTFKVNFERGNHYAILIRKAGYFAKRLDAYVDVNGCILCFEGVGNVQPGVSDVLTEGNKMGTLLANIEMRPLQYNLHTRLDNVSFETGGAELLEAAKIELDKLVSILQDNQDLTVEISAHSDARGADDYNLQLSQFRAESIVNYLLNSGNIEPNQLIARGYGETQLVNSCKNDVVCSDELHRQNRRAEWKVLTPNQTFTTPRTLAQILELEAFNESLTQLGAEDQMIIKAGETLPVEIARDVEEYGIDVKKINVTANPDGIPLVEEITPTDVYAQVTNATRLTEENYGQATDREVMKTQPMLTAYQSPYVENFDNKVPQNRPEENIPTPYEEALEKQKILQSSGYGETVVAYAKNKAKTVVIPNNYTGYKVEFLTSMVELGADHKIFSQHGNITIEQKENGVYSYLLGDFQDQKEAETFLKEVMLLRYPTANLVYYSNGISGRKVKRNSTQKTGTKPPQ